MVTALNPVQEDHVNQLIAAIETCGGDVAAAHRRLAEVGIKFRAREYVPAMDHFIDGHQFDIADGLFRYALAEGKTNAELYAVAMDHYINSHQLGMADSLFEQASAERKINATLLARKAKICGIREHRLEAESHIAQALALDPNNPDAHFERGVGFAFENRYQEAAEAFETAYNHMPKHDPRMLERHARCLIDIGQYDRALEMLNEQQTLEPQRAGAALKRAICYIRLDRPQDAFNAAQEALEISLEHENFPNNRRIIGALRLQRFISAWEEDAHGELTKRYQANRRDLFGENLITNGECSHFNDNPIKLSKMTLHPFAESDIGWLKMMAGITLPNGHHTARHTTGASASQTSGIRTLS